MTQFRFRHAESYWYLATLYSEHPGGLETAFEEAAEQANFLLGEGIPVFCPIVHGHPISFGDLPNDYSFWLGLDRLFLKIATGLLICQMPGWEKSKGIMYERGLADGYGKPTVFMETFVVPHITWGGQYAK